jgi:hypothetical protein
VSTTADRSGYGDTSPDRLGRTGPNTESATFHKLRRNATALAYRFFASESDGNVGEGTGKNGTCG